MNAFCIFTAAFSLRSVYHSGGKPLSFSGPNARAHLWLECSISTLSAVSQIPHKQAQLGLISASSVSHFHLGTFSYYLATLN